MIRSDSRKGGIIPPSHGLSDVALVQNVLAEPQMRLSGIVANVANTSGEVLFVAHQAIKIIALPKHTVFANETIDAHRRLPFPRVNNLLKRPLLCRCEQRMDVIRHHNGGNNVDPRSIEMARNAIATSCAQARRRKTHEQ
jgi:hypothetical protein